jgi:hypothetical protein
VISLVSAAMLKYTNKDISEEYDARAEPGAAIQPAE